MHRTLIVAALASLAACAPEPEAPVRVSALVLTNSGTYVPQEVQLTTVTNVVSMEGVVAKLVGGARIRSDSQDPELINAPTEEAFGNAMIKGGGRDVTASFITHDGVLWPADFHTWNMVTAYYNFEKAFDYFRTVGNIPLADFGDPITVYYFPEFILADTSGEALKDNALYFPPVQAFMVLPFDELQRAPLAINAGIMAHEYSHLIFNKKVYGGRRLPEALIQWSGFAASPGANLLKSLDEGLADYHGFGTTCDSPTGCDTRFLRTSFDDKFSNDRDLAKSDRCMDVFLRTSLNQDNLSTFGGAGREYVVGSILASALYQAGQAGGLAQHKTLQRALVSAYSDTTPNNPGLAQLVNLTLGDQTNFNLISASAVIINHITDLPLKTAVCNEFIDHLAIPASALSTVCPPSAQGGNTCPRLPNP
ncbi:hypothetical protein [Hyalangium rubrum]|uniref:Uncharacterized protein n=1 Tax=Hyalangium rubrum TaxID=3103134 RepID=A0ABU5H7C6_9BACT|nr:hypothetical protein [Hyalangium sp. s54d21]MDY7229388.1 hypothetical protein [Hyalangium sp. s54d21]